VNFRDLQKVVTCGRLLCRYADLVAGVWCDWRAARALYEHAAFLVPGASEIRVEFSRLLLWSAAVVAHGGRGDGEDDGVEEGGGGG